MDHCVARHTALSKHNPSALLIVQGAFGCRWHVASVAGILMTLIAYERNPSLQHALGCGAMRVMANRAILLHGGVIAEKRPALFCMAGIAGCIDGFLDQRLLAR